MPGTGQPRPASGKVTNSVDWTVTWSTGTAASRAMSATTGSTTEADRPTGPGLAVGSRDGWRLAGSSEPATSVEGAAPLGDAPGDPLEAAVQPATSHSVANRAIRTTIRWRWYPRVLARGPPWIGSDEATDGRIERVMERGTLVACPGPMAATAAGLCLRRLEELVLRRPARVRPRRVAALHPGQHRHVTLAGSAHDQDRPRVPAPEVSEASGRAALAGGPS